MESVMFDLKMIKWSCLSWALVFMIIGKVNVIGANESKHPNQPYSDKPDTFWTYKTIDGKALKMSVFLPEGYGEGKSFPTFVVFHGGSWRTGEPSWHYPDCAYWRSRGMVAVSVEYRLKDIDKIKVPLECVKDARSAVRYLRKNAEILKVNPDKLVVAGGSAGGQLAAALATIVDPSVNHEDDDLKVSCVPNAVILYNPYFKCQPSLSPSKHIKKDLPPMVTFLGSEDHAITIESLLEFHSNLKKHGNASEFYVGNGGKHGFCNGRNTKNKFFYWSLELEDQFLIKHGMLGGEPKVMRPRSVHKLQNREYKAFF
jgi:acetyl esterase